MVVSIRVSTDSGIWYPDIHVYPAANTCTDIENMYIVQ